LKPSLFLIKKIFLWIAFFEILTVAMMNWAVASPDTIVKVEPYANAALVGGTFTASIAVTDVQNLYGLEVTVSWNASVLNIVGVNVRLGIESHPDGVLHEIPGIAPINLYQNETIQGQGKYVLAASSSAPAASFNGSGNLVRLTFNVKNRGNTRLALETRLADRPPPGGVSSPITHTSMSGVFGPIHVFISPSTVTLGENVNISGFLAQAQANVNVTIQYRLEAETEWHALPIEKTNNKGNYKQDWRPTREGKYKIRASAFIGGFQETSYLVDLTVNPQESFIIWQYIAAIAVVIAAGLIIGWAYRKRSKEH